MRSNLSAIIFDFDGVLADTMKDNYRAWKRALSEYKRSLNEVEYFRLEGMPLIKIAGIFCEKKKLDIKIADDLVLKKEKFYLADHHFKFYPGVLTIVGDLYRKKIKMAIVSGAHINRLKKTVPSEFLKKFDVVISGDSIKQGKPFPDPYLKACELLNVRPQRAIVVENAPLGIKAAKRAGCFCIAIASTLDKSELKESDVVINRFGDLRNQSMFKNVKTNVN